MFAAARLADLPELRQLRTMLNERYGNSLESCVNNQVTTHSLHPQIILAHKISRITPLSCKKYHLFLAVCCEIKASMA